MKKALVNAALVAALVAAGGVGAGTTLLAIDRESDRSCDAATTAAVAYATQANKAQAEWDAARSPIRPGSRISAADLADALAGSNAQEGAAQPQIASLEQRRLELVRAGRLHAQAILGDARCFTPEQRAEAAEWLAQTD